MAVIYMLSSFICFQLQISFVLSNNHLQCDESVLCLFEEKIAHLENELNITKTRISNQDSEIKALQDDLDQTKAQLLLKKQSVTNQSNAVAFTAYMIGGNNVLQVGGIIPFTKVIINEQGYYDTNTSKFMCITGGIYMFSFSLHTAAVFNGAKYVRIDVELIRSDGLELTRAHCQNENSTSMRIQCASSAISECSMGQSVWLKASYYENKIYGTSIDKNSVFSGFLIKEM